MDDITNVVESLRAIGTDTSEVEVKKASGGFPKSAWESVSAFANTRGGIIIFGLVEPDFTPAPDFDPQPIQNAAISGLDFKAPQGAKVDPIPGHEISVAEVDGSPVVILRVDPVAPGKVCCIAGKDLANGSYKRVGDADKRMTPYEIYLATTRHTDLGTDREAVKGATVDDLDDELCQALFDKLRAQGTRAFSSDDPDRLKRERLGICTADDVPTLAGILSLGRYPQQFFPQLFIDVTVYESTDKAPTSPTVRYLDSRRCEGPIPVAVQDAVETVMKNLRHRRVVHGVSGFDEPEIPEDVVREAIVNAVAHRDYSTYVLGQQVAVDLYSDRLEVISPGGLFGNKTPENLDDGISNSRNRHLVRILQDVPNPNSGGTVAENRGTGIQRMEKSMRSHGLPIPGFTISHAEVKVVLSRFGLMDEATRNWLDSLPSESRSMHNDAALALARIDGTISVSSLRRQLGIDSDDARNVLGVLLGDGLLQSAGSETYRLAPREPSNPNEELVLRHLSRSTPATIRDLATATGLTLPALRPLLRHLVSTGEVTPTAPPTSKNRAYLKAR